MTQPVLESPGDVFLRSGDPENFLRDNLPSVNTDDVTAPPGHLRAVVLLAGAFMAWRTYMKSELRKELAPVDVAGATARLWKRYAPSWMRIAVPLVHEAYLAMNLGMTPQERQLVAVDYAAQLGQYVHETSAEALVQGYTRELNRGITPGVAWMRVTEAYGLDSREMERWLRLVGTDKTLVRPGSVFAQGAIRAVDKAILQRADILGETEAWNARQVGKSIVWMASKEEGRYPTGTKKRWLTADDERVCPICGPLHRQVVEIEEQFLLPDGQRLWAPGVHPRCRCELELVYPLPVGEFEVTKAQGDDPYDRDRRGRFAEREQRQAETQAAPVQDPYLTRLMQQAAELQSAQDANLMAADADLLGTSLFQATDMSLVADADLLATDADLLGGTLAAPKRRRRKIIILVNGREEEVEADSFAPGPNQVVFSPVFLYQNYMNQRSYLSGDKQFLIDETVDFDEWKLARASEHHRGDREAPRMFTAQLKLTNDPTHVFIESLTDSELDYDDSEASQAHMSDTIDAFMRERHRAAEKVLDNPNYYLARMTNPDVRDVYRRAGQYSVQMSDKIIDDVLRENLLEAVQLDTNEKERVDLTAAFVEWQLEHADFPALTSVMDMIKEDEDSPWGENFWTEHPPQIFTFSGQGTDFLSAGSPGGSLTPVIDGRWRVARTILHSETLEHGDRLPNPRVPVWREVVLVRDSDPDDPAEMRFH